MSAQDRVSNFNYVHSSSKAARTWLASPHVFSDYERTPVYSPDTDAMALQDSC
jgi:hypothetical protein